MAIPNKYQGKCPCGKMVLPGKGFVIGRRITCANCGGEALGAREQEIEEERGRYDEYPPIYGFGDAP